MSSAICLRTALIACAKAGMSESFTNRLSDRAILRLCYDWDSWARDDQRPPLNPWSIWMLMGGRGSGKTRAGAEWVRGAIEGRVRYADEPSGHIALVGETFADAREVMVEGVSGLRRTAPPWNQLLRGDPQAPGLGEWRRRSALFCRGSGIPSRAAIRCGMVRRDRQMALWRRRI